MDTVMHAVGFLNTYQDVESKLKDRTETLW